MSRAVLQGIATRSPGATTYVVNYSAIFPHEGGQPNLIGMRAISNLIVAASRA